MSTPAVRALEGVIRQAQRSGRTTPRQIAEAIDAAQLVQSPEKAAELAGLRERAATCTCHSSRGGTA